MPILDDNMELDPSDNSEPLDVGQEAADEAALPDESADSSDAQGATPDDTLSIVRDVVEEAREPEGSASPAEGETGEKPAETDAEKSKDDYSDVPFHTHPRFQQLIRERNAFEKNAGLYQNVQNFMDENGITPQEAADGFVIMAQLKSDPVKAWEALKPIVQNLLITIGEVLPDDLVARVNSGELTQAAAYEISKSRAAHDSLQASQTFREQQQQRRLETAHAQSLYDAAVEWESDRRAKDPNFAAKLVALQKELVFIHAQEGKATTPEGVRDQLKRAYANVVPPAAPAPRPQAPARPAVNTRLPTSGQVPTKTSPKPQTTLDIIKAARAQRTG